MTNKLANKKLQVSSLLVLLAVVLLSAGCAKKVAKATPTATPPAPATPTATLAANPSTIEQGQSTTLTWQTTNANEVTIAGLGTVPASGSRSVAPGTSTSYTLVAAGPGGTKDASARVTVNQKTVAAYSPSDEELFAKNVKDVFFDYNVSRIRPDETTTAQQDADFPQAASEYQRANRRALRRPGLDRIQPGSGNEPGGNCEAGSPSARGSSGSPQDDQLRQGKAILQPGRRTVLAAEPGRPLRFSTLSSWRAAFFKAAFFHKTYLDSSGFVCT